MATQYARAPVDFDDLQQYVDLEFDDMAEFDEVYFLGDHTRIFSLRASSIARLLVNFAGVVVFSISEEKRLRISQQLDANTSWSFVLIDELINRHRAAGKTSLLIDFNENLAGKNISKKLASTGIAVRDCLFAMHQLNLCHTYVTVRDERDYVVAHLDEFKAAAAEFGDALSHQTLYSRLKSVLCLDRTALIEASFPLNNFINNFSATAGLVVREDEIFIDAGAAHGDTASQFFHISRGKYSAIHAFEPDPKNFELLRMLCEYLPNTTAYFAGLGEKAGTFAFYEYPENRFGSNFVAQSATHQVKSEMAIMKLDDVVDRATLIKIDVEGWESNVIKGAANVIRNSQPNMTISAYHYPKDILEIMAAVGGIHKYKYIALRHYSPSLYDTQLVFSDHQQFY
jgi:FkbM family methyltransferase